MQRFIVPVIAPTIAREPHDFADGPVTFMLATHNSRWRTIGVLVVDALAPVAGALPANVLLIEPWLIGYQLAVFASFLLCLSASARLPQVDARSRFPLIFSTMAGLLTAGAVVLGLSTLY